MTLNEIIELQSAFDKRHFSNGNWAEHITENNSDKLEHLLVCLMGEVGETANIVKKITRGDVSFNQKFSELAEEITDIFIYTIKLIYQLDINIEEEYIAKMARNEERFKSFER